MNIGRSLILAGLLVAATIAAGAWAWLTLPADAYLPIHGGLGHGGLGLLADGQLGKLPALAILPLVSLLVVGLLGSLPRRAPDTEGLERSPLPFGLLIIALAGVFLVSEVAVAQRLASPDFNVLRPVAIAMGCCCWRWETTSARRGRTDSSA